MTRRLPRMALAALAVGAPVASLSASPRTVPAVETEARERAAAPSRAADPWSSGDPLVGEAAADGPSRVIVGLRLPWRQEGLLAPAGQEEQRLAITIAQEELLDELRGTDAALIHNFTSIPFQVLEVTPAALDQLRSSPLVSVIEPDRILKPTLAESVPLIQGDQAWAAGYDGTGIAVAVLDTGVEAAHSFFGGRVVAEACFSTNATNVVSLCPNGQTSQIGVGAASPAACSGISGCDHGTHVAGIAAGSGASFSGVARGASIIGVQVFSKFTSAVDCGGAAPCVSSFFSDLIRGLEHVLTLKDTYPIASVNMSLGGGKYTSDPACDAANAAVKAAIDNLRSVGIASVIASGNDGFTDGIATPGCVSTAVAVGSTTKQDTMSSFSNSSPMVELLAPGSTISSSVTGDAFGVKSGTSMATPHVTGAWAILKEQNASATVSEILAALSASGLNITDARNGVTKPRIRIKNALNPGLYVNDVSVAEGNSGTVNATFTVTLSPSAGGTVTVQYQTANGTATSGADYVAASGTLTFLAGETSKLLTVAVNGDVVQETDETFFVDLSNATGGVAIADGQGLGTIRDDDAPSCSVVAPGVVDGTFEAGTPWPAWTTQASTNFGSPLCDTLCGDGAGTAPPYAGSNWAWFGGVAAAETGVLGQSLALPVSTDLRLRFQMRMGAVAAPANDTFVVAVDGAPVRTFAEPAFAEAAYSEREISLTPFADGGVHALRFTYSHPDAAIGSLTVDNVQVVNCQGPSLPTLSIGDASVSEGNAGTSTATFTVSLSAASTSTLTVSYSTANGTATAGSDYATASGTLTFPPGSTTQSIPVTVNGDTAVEPNETFFVNLSGATTATLGDAQGVGTIVNDDLPTLSVSDVAVTEGHSGTTGATFTVTLSAVSERTVTVDYATADGSAVAGGDYLAVSGTLTFPPGSTTQSLGVAVNGDTFVEATETFFVNLGGATSATIADAEGVGTIVNDDLPTLSVNDVAVTEGSSGTASATFTVTLSPVSGQTVTVDYATSDGSATAGSDYVAVSGTLTFPPGSTTQSFPVTVNGDSVVEPDETFFVDLSGATNATIADAQGVAAVNNDEGSATRIWIDDRAVAEGSATNASFRVTLDVASSQTVTVKYATANGTATAPSDYTATSGTLTFTPGRTTHSVAVPIVTDTTPEGSESFTVNLTGATNATVARSQATGTIGDPPAPATVPMYRAYNFSADYHFFTTSLAEKDNAVANGYRDESKPVPFNVPNTGVAGASAIFRMYNPNSGRHYYTASAGERDSLKGVGWIYEKDEGFIYSSPQSGTAEVFRLYNNNSGVHLYTASAGEKDAILATFPGIWVQHATFGYAMP